MSAGRVRVSLSHVQCKIGSSCPTSLLSMGIYISLYEVIRNQNSSCMKWLTLLLERNISVGFSNDLFVFFLHFEKHEQSAI